MDARKPRKRPIDLLSPDQVRALAHACSRRSACAVRDRALIVALWATGLRISEALDLLPRHVDLDALTVVVQSGKGDKRRVVAMLPDAVDPLERWLARRREFGVGPEHPLFCTVSRGARGVAPTRPGGRLTREHVARVLRRLARKVGLPGRCHPHALRHAHASLLRARGLDVYALKVQLGHEHLDTTDRYLHRLGVSELPDKLRAMGPILEPRERDPAAELAALVGRLPAAVAAPLLAIVRGVAQT